jgi:hypothetical protein
MVRRSISGSQVTLVEVFFCVGTPMFHVSETSFNSVTVYISTELHRVLLVCTTYCFM